MKKLTMITALFISTTMVGIAQESSLATDNREKFQVGGKIGLNYSNVYDAKGEQFNADAKFGLAGGVFMCIPIGKYIGVHPEVLLSQKGFQASGILLGSPYNFTRTTTYLDIPLLLEFRAHSL